MHNFSPGPKPTVERSPETSRTAAYVVSPCSCRRCGDIINACLLETRVGSRDPVFAQPQYQMNFWRLLRRLKDIESGEEKWESRGKSGDGLLKYWETREYLDTQPFLPLWDFTPKWALEDEIIREMLGWPPHDETRREEWCARRRREWQDHVMTPQSVSPFTENGSNGWITPHDMKPEFLHALKPVRISDLVCHANPGTTSLPLSPTPPTAETVSSSDQRPSYHEYGPSPEYQDYENSDPPTSSTGRRSAEHTFLALDCYGNRIIAKSSTDSEHLDSKCICRAASTAADCHKRKRSMSDNFPQNTTTNLLDSVHTPVLRSTERVRYNT
ncbi:hypothetical protein GJ744_009015 [Endocarpon pusillum]|uniref:Uncharacterized protein n=1 Tax=Endocarpon pusillum TaxID=364733 RepID=A0A8H7AGD8_9EURO|nr:hypothetical protein GJ744_009015 [Endocarpon pusillum]